MTTYALPCLFELFPKLNIQRLLNDVCSAGSKKGACFSSHTLTNLGKFSEIQLQALVGIMKQAKTAGAINSVTLEALTFADSGMTIAGLLDLLVSHKDGNIRQDCLQLVCTAKRQTDEISELERNTFAKWLVTNIKVHSKKAF